mmetsp:Transcript_26205/g.31797  ORF Transcript_26205/g.31797 Transcript_26205/m.31797 type:complete len:373 (+) Transcript_26205:278-1396(+)|eukprot:CAMPEP_0197844302 /NCGR_PEP_ID=MMETSP1438-20131217/1282_1 /TAXON_ID=1461541 /ORGANISM="Pterosperma sp., Strain CCMP1384" /LENGTH=372 /DNA_ID=CAMNT_0043455013 /DNA_START=274 /DNA_END=1392 /DNA_ORIENTATION=+
MSGLQPILSDEDSDEEAKKQRRGRKFECSLCLQQYVDPIKTPCKHTFCRACITKALDRSASCPLCRKALSREEFSPNLAPSCAALIREMGGVPPLRVKFLLGNHTGTMPETCGLRNRRWWRVFFKLARGDDAAASKLLSRVVVTLEDQDHPNDPPSVYQLKEAPFEIARVGSSTQLNSNEVRITVYFKPQYKQEAVELTHELLTDGEDVESSNIVVIELNQPDMQRIAKLAHPKSLMQLAAPKRRPSDVVIPPWLGGPAQAPSRSQSATARRRPTGFLTPHRSLKPQLLISQRLPGSQTPNSVKTLAGTPGYRSASGRNRQLLPPIGPHDRNDRKVPQLSSRSFNNKRSSRYDQEGRLDRDVEDVQSVQSEG